MAENEKLGVFLNAVRRGADDEAAAITEETTAAEKDALDKLEARLRAEMKLKVEEAVHQADAAAELRVTAAVLESRRRLLEFREACSAQVFAEVRRRLLAYPDSPEYPGTLCDLLYRALACIPGAGEVEVQLRPEDMKHADALRAGVCGFTLGFVPGSFRLGGLIVVSRSANLRVDLSFDTALDDADGSFAELTGFRVEEEQ